MGTNLGRPAKRGNRAVFNTTIDRSVMKSFRERCQEIGTPMNVIVEAFMSQFSKGEFVVKIGKNNLEVDFDDEE